MKDLQLQPLIVTGFLPYRNALPSTDYLHQKSHSFILLALRRGHVKTQRRMQNWPANRTHIHSSQEDEERKRQAGAGKHASGFWTSESDCCYIPCARWVLHGQAFAASLGELCRELLHTFQLQQHSLPKHLQSTKVDQHSPSPAITAC